MSKPLSPKEMALQAVRRHGAMQKASELAALLEILQGRRVRNVLEIGGMHGGTMWCWQQIATGKLICIDSFVLEGRMEKTGAPITLVNSDSHEDHTRRTVLRALKGERVDLLFIDGDHSYDGVRQDFESYTPLVAPDGIIALHDVSVNQRAAVRPQHDVVPYWNQLTTIFPVYREVFDPGEYWGGIGILLDYLPAHIAAATELGEPTDADRAMGLPCDEYCEDCAAPLQSGEDLLCTECAGKRP